MGGGSTGWVSPRRRVVARISVFLAAYSLGLLLALVIAGAGQFSQAFRLYFIIHAVMGILAFLVYDIVIGLELIDKRVIEGDLDVAKRIQSQLVPAELPVHSNLSFAAYYDPARAVGGDYYDVIALTEDKYALVVADVAGKGTPAALLMSAVRTQMRVLAAEGFSPDLLTSRLNRSLCSELTPSRFVTLFVSFLDAKEGTMQYVNAGHEGALHLSAKNPPRHLGEGGMPAGVLADTDYGLGTCRLEPGDSLFLFTDGVTEAENVSREQFGSNRLFRLLSELGDLPADQMIERVVAEIKRHRGSEEQTDDIAILVCKRIA